MLAKINYSVKKNVYGEKGIRIEQRRQEAFDCLFEGANLEPAPEFPCPVPGRWIPFSCPSFWSKERWSRRFWASSKIFMTGLRRNKQVASSDHKCGRRLSDKAETSLRNRPGRHRFWLQASSWYRKPYFLPDGRPRTRRGYRPCPSQHKRRSASLCRRQSFSRNQSPRMHPSHPSRWSLHRML